MAPIEVFFGAFVLVFALIGIVRGFLRELGVTTVMMVVLLALHLLEPLLEQGLARVVESPANPIHAASAASAQTWFFEIVILVAAFISYAGETLAFRGDRLGGVLGMALSLVTGAVNGYLIVGSIWYYLDRWDYALKFLGLSVEGLSETAQGMVRYLPLNLLGQPLFLGQSWLLYLALFLLIARVIR
jgi:uncharacterized membrane protein required for colicin V production